MWGISVFLLGFRTLFPPLQAASCDPEQHSHPLAPQLGWCMWGQHLPSVGSCFPELLRGAGDALLPGAASPDLSLVTAAGTEPCWV